MVHGVARRTLLAGLALAFAAPAWPAGDTGQSVGILAATPAEFGLLLRLARGLDHEDGLRIVPMAGKGPVQTLTDLVALKGVDAALVSSDTLPFMERAGLLGDRAGKIAYLLRVAPLDIHVIAKDGITSPADLKGKRVVAGPVSGNAYVAGQLLMQATGLAAEVLELEPVEALRAVRGGKADAAILVGAKPLPELRLLPSASGLHLLDVTAPEGLKETYAPSLLKAEDYPQLIASGQMVETLSASLVVAVFDWKPGTAQYAKLRRFAAALFKALQPGGPDDVPLNLAASVPGWTRHAAADEVLEARATAILSDGDSP